MNFYKQVNNVTGWVIFLIALVTYTLTLEATTSFWDCGEFISGAYKMQVVHPPGAPLFLLVGRLFTIFAFDDPNWIAWTVNFLSGLTSAFAVLFLFWITTGFAKKIVAGSNEPTKQNTLVIVATGVIAALACTWTDTIWFSAVEGEVYAMSLFFMMFVFWVMMKWESAEDNTFRDRWLVLVAFLLGVSSGVHLLSFLAIPALALIYYLKKYEKPTPLGVVIALGVGVALLGFFFKGIVSKMVGIIAGFELAFTNSMGAPFGTGFAVFVILLISAVIAGIVYAHIKDKHNLHLALMSFAMVLVGFSTYSIVVIRANADTPINMNKPSNVFALESYLNREQYGDRPLLYGPHYNAYPIDRIVTGKKHVPSTTRDGKDTYQFIGDKIGYKFNPDEEMFFPRMGSWQDEGHQQAYRTKVQPDFKVVRKNTTNPVKVFKNTTGWRDAYNAAQSFVSSQSNPADYAVKDIVKEKHNWSFFLNYQVGVMYWRYFMWNFSGRQNDIQGRYDNNDGKWVTGIPFIDKNRVGPSENAPDYLKENMAHNVYFMLPFILGLIGMFFHFQKDPRGAFIVLTLFLFAGVLQVVYLNSPPYEPRERDYTLVGSFVTFCLWIGFGMLAIYKTLEKKTGFAAALGVSLLLSISVPAILVSQNWDDHDRSGRYTARDYAVNYLQSCKPNAVVFTQGDNDTYPLWYAQEVDGIRTDVRVVNLSLLGVDWYIEQLNRKINDAPPLKMTLTPDKYLGSNRDYVQYYAAGNLGDDYKDLGQIVAWIASESDQTKLKTQSGDKVDYLPTRNFKIPVNKAEVIKQGIVDKNYEAKIVDDITWTLPKTNLLKNDLVTLDILANNLWDRPIYFAVSVSPDAYLGLNDYLQLEGLAYRVVPVNNSGSYTGYIATDMMFDNIMNKFVWGGVERKDTISYTVASGDSLAGIAYDHNLTVSELKNLNGLTSNDVAAGTKLKIKVSIPMYMDENVLRMTMNLRSNFGRLAEELIAEGRPEDAVKVLDYCLDVLPLENVPYNLFMIRFPEVYYKVGNKEKAQLLTRKMLDIFEAQFKFATDTQDWDPGSNTARQQALAVIQELSRIASTHNDAEMQKIITDRANELKNWM